MDKPTSNAKRCVPRRSIIGDHAYLELKIDGGIAMVASDWIAAVIPNYLSSAIVICWSHEPIATIHTCSEVIEAMKSV